MYVDVSERFTLVIKHLLENRFLKNQAELAQILSLSKGYVSQLVNGQREPSSEVVSKLANSFPIINEGWLLTGADGMLKDSTQSANPVEEMLRLEADHIPQLSNTEILLRDMLAEERARNEALNEIIWELKEENGKLKALMSTEHKGGLVTTADFSSVADVG